MAQRRNDGHKICIDCRHCVVKEVTPKKRRWRKQGKPATALFCTAVRSLINGEVIVAPCTYRRYGKPLPSTDPGECNRGQLWEPRTNA